MEFEFGRPDMLSSAVPAVAIAFVAVVTLALWIGGHLVRRRVADPWLRAGLGVLRLLAACVPVWCALQCLGRVFILASLWPLWSLSLTGAAAVEAAVWLYGLERGVAPRRAGMILTALRVGIVALVFFMLIQPVLRTEVRRKIERFVVVLLDASDSMAFRDRQWTDTERLNLAALYGSKAVEGRVRVDRMAPALLRIERGVSAEAQALRPGESAAPEAVRTFLEARAPILTAYLKDDTVPAIGKLAEELRALQANPALAPDRKSEASRFAARLTEGALPKLKQAADKVRAGFGPGVDARGAATFLAEMLSGAGQDILAVAQALPGLAAAYDSAFAGALAAPLKAEVDAAGKHSRQEIARQCLAGSRGREPSLLERIEKQYQVKVVTFGGSTREGTVEDLLKEQQKAEPLPPPDASATAAATNAPPANAGATVSPAASADEAFAQVTDIAGAMEMALRSVPAENLAGVLLVSDGRHNVESGVDAVAHGLGAQRSPVCAIPVGSTLSPPDASILSVKVPEAVYLGDKVSVRADLKFDGLKGRALSIRLLQGGKEVSKQQISVPDGAYRTTVRFAHTPESQGIMRYSLEIDPQEGEIMVENNRWQFDTAVSDDRTNVLLVDSRPRWEFRYLRNLFYGRDKSVHLQFVLLEPDRLAGAPAEEPVHASAARKFGDAEASALPESRDEWLKFDIIILGDVPAKVLTPEAVETLQYCVRERGALLVCIAGPRFMPHGIDDEVLREMLPIRYDESTDFLFDPPEDEYRLRLTPEGRVHDIMRQSTSPSENTEVWDRMPTLDWRHPIMECKEGASVLAYAERVDSRKEKDIFDDGGVSAEAAAAAMQRQMKMRSANALIVEHRYGQGRVLMLNFDRTWRLRYRVGDTHHHRFWGQVLKWGGGENLRAGTELVRLGTDLITYASGEKVKVMAKLTQEDRKPVLGADVAVKLFQGERLITRKRLGYREASNGIYETVLAAPETVGHYRVELESPEAERLLARDKADRVVAEFNVVTTKNPVELAELTADHALMGRVAELSGGESAGPQDADGLLAHFGKGTQTVVEKRERPLWDRWPLLLAIVACATIEWVLRRRVGLA